MDVRRNRRAAERSAIAATARMEQVAAGEERTMLLPIITVALIVAALGISQLSELIGAATGVVGFLVGFAVIFVVARERHGSRL